MNSFDPAKSVGEMKSDRDSEFEGFVRRRRPALLRSATLLTNGDAHLAEDLVQMTLVRLYLKWSHVRKTNIDAYARRVLVNKLIDHHRGPAVRRERCVDDVPDVAFASHGHRLAVVDGCIDHQLLSALATLPPRMRAAVVLRYVEGLSVDEAADALCCRAGTVKSQASRGLEKLRRQLEPPPAVIDIAAPPRLSRSV